MAKDIGTKADGLQSGQSINIVITLVNSPTDFCIQIFEESKIQQWSDFNAKMTEDFQSSPGGYR